MACIHIAWDVERLGVAWDVELMVLHGMSN